MSNDFLRSEHRSCGICRIQEHQTIDSITSVHFIGKSVDVNPCLLIRTFALLVLGFTLSAPNTSNQGIRNRASESKVEGEEDSRFLQKPYQEYRPVVVVSVLHNIRA